MAGGPPQCRQESWHACDPWVSRDHRVTHSAHQKAATMQFTLGLLGHA